MGRVLGIDIGGAHIKLANAVGDSAARYFPMWLRADELSSALRHWIDCFCLDTSAAYSHLAVTMTGEMADCFTTRAAGVAYILRQVESALTTVESHVYSVDGDWLSPQSASQRPWDVAASNWHALAQWIGQHVVEEDEHLRLVLDIGSTTVDVIPMVEGRVATNARCDSDRLRKQQLLYTGMG
ncbi:MAG: hydantoinase/oxoprolinase family protein, partial [Aureliella sp.]